MIKTRFYFCRMQDYWAKIKLHLSNSYYRITAWYQQVFQDLFPAVQIMDGTEIYPKNENSNGTEIHANISHVDYDYLRTLGIQILKGRNFSKDFPTDSSGIVINEAAVQNWVGQMIMRLERPLFVRASRNLK